MRLTIDIPESVRGREINATRARDIISKISRGRTLESVGQEYNISRERVRQIYKKYTGLPARIGITKREITRSVILRDKMKKFKFVCRLCERNVTVGEATNRSRYCSRCIPESNQLTKTKSNGMRANSEVKCHGCGRTFSPTRQQIENAIMRDNYSGNMYHTIECFRTYKLSKLRTKKGVK